MCVRRCGRVRKKHHCEADEDSTRQRLQRRVSAAHYIFTPILPNDLKLCYCPFYDYPVNEEDCRCRNPACERCPGAAAPAGPSIPCKAANICSSLLCFPPPFRVIVQLSCMGTWKYSPTQMADKFAPTLSCFMWEGERLWSTQAYW